MIECYLQLCPFHECNQENGIEGPFCAQEFCMLNDDAVEFLYMKGMIAKMEKLSEKISEEEYND